MRDPERTQDRRAGPRPFSATLEGSDRCLTTRFWGGAPVMPTDAIVMLKADHKEIRRLFREFQSAGDRAVKKKGKLVDANPAVAQK